MYHFINSLFFHSGQSLICESHNRRTAHGSLFTQSLAICIMMICGDHVFAADSPTKTMVPPQSESCPLLELEKRWAQILTTGLTEKLVELLDEEFFSIDSVGNLQDRESYIRNVSPQKAHLKDYVIENVEIKNRGNFAVLTATVGIVGESNERDISAFYQIIDTFVLQERGWRAISRSETKIASRTDPLWERVGKPDGNPRVVLFVQGSYCPHCMAQISTFARDLGGRHCKVTVVSGDTEDDLNKFPNVPFSLLADPDHRLFRRFGAFGANKPMHATVAMDGKGNLVFSNIGERPFMDAGVVIRWIERAQTAETARNKERRQ